MRRRSCGRRINFQKFLLRVARFRRAISIVLLTGSTALSLRSMVMTIERFPKIRHMCWEAFALMRDLDAYYVRMMHVGLLAIRRALGEHNCEWAERLVDLLHNLPSLIGETKPERHSYFWNFDRASYLDWVTCTLNHACSLHMENYFVPIWNKMEQAAPATRDLLVETKSATPLRSCTIMQIFFTTRLRSPRWPHL